MNTDPRQEEIIEEFSIFDDNQDKTAYVIDLGKTLPKIDDKHRNDQYLIKGCQSRVWIDAEYKDGKVYYTADSDALITKGMISLLIRVLDERTPQDILDTDLYFIEKIGLNNLVSMHRANGLLGMIKQMRLYALAFQAQELKTKEA